MEGVRGYFRGLIPSLCQIIPFAGKYFLSFLIKNLPKYFFILFILNLNFSNNKKTLEQAFTNSNLHIRTKFYVLQFVQSFLAGDISQFWCFTWFVSYSY